MILTKLAQYYERLASETDHTTGDPKVPPYGFSDEKIGYILVLSQQGELVDVFPNLTKDKKPIPKLLSVPRPEKRTSGIKPNFLWDKTAYVLGVESNKDKKTAKEQPISYAKETFEAFKKMHLEKLSETEDVGLKALSSFLQQWQPEQFEQSVCPIEVLDANVVFKLDGQYLHQCTAAQTLWNAMLLNEDAEQSLCLISGKEAPIARLHPAIKGVFGGQSSGGSIISFNKESFTSYGKEQGANSPVSEQAAFAYTTALNYLLRPENGHNVVIDINKIRQQLKSTKKSIRDKIDMRPSIGNTSTVFWAEADNAQSAVETEDFFANILSPPDDEQENTKIFNLLEQVAKGRPLQELNPELAENTRFYVLGLSPNAARISVRFWLDTTFGQLARHLARHWQDLQLSPPAWKNKPPSIWRVLVETTPKLKDINGRLKKSDSKDIPSQLAGEYMRSVLTGYYYPRTMLTRLISRIRSDGYISGLRVAVIKAVINRNNRYKEEITMGLNEITKDIPYRLGRLFAIIELAQISALGELNAGVRDKFYGGASSTPHSTFPLLLDNYRTHISALRKGRKAKWVKGDAQKLAIWLEKKVSEIVEVFDAKTPFPRHLSLEEQGRFVIGYYQQKFKKYSKQDDNNLPEDIALSTYFNDETNLDTEEN